MFINGKCSSGNHPKPWRCALSLKLSWLQGRLQGEIGDILNSLQGKRSKNNTFTSSAGLLLTPKWRTLTQAFYDESSMTLYAMLCRKGSKKDLQEDLVLQDFCMITPADDEDARTLDVTVGNLMRYAGMSSDVPGCVQCWACFHCSCCTER
jgi:hypothetical protein